MSTDPYQYADDERVRLRTTFDTASARYEQARPSYPEELFDALVDVTGLQPGDRLLEVGPGSGKATGPLAGRGFRITCVELGAELAAVAARRFARSPNVSVVHDSFETWTPPADVSFDLVYAATAWHWVDSRIRFQKAAEVLRTGGYLAVWGAAHVVPEGGDPFFEEIQDVYDEIGEAMPADRHFPRPGELSEPNLEEGSGGLFQRVAVRHYDWETSYDADGYVDLLNTFSGHLSMQPWQRDRLFGEIRRRLGARPDGRLRRHWGCVLEVARLRPTV